MTKSSSVLTLDADAAARLVEALLRNCGASPANASTVSNHLTENSRLGIHSHGLIRVPQYMKEIREGLIDPRARPRLVRTRGAVAWVSGNSSFGSVGGMFAANRAVGLARKHGVGLVIAGRLGHTGRIGAYAEAIAAQRCVAIVFGNAPPRGHFVAPYGGVDGRLPTNPIAFAIPNGTIPIFADFSTSAQPEGKVRSARNRGVRMPPGVLQDAKGRPTDDPEILYHRPRGTLLPLGGPEFGHKGYALAILVEAMTTLLAGEKVDDASRNEFDLTVLAIATAPSFERATAGLARYLRSSRPADPARPVMVPGDPERLARLRSTVEVDAPTWRAMKTLARELGVKPPDPL